VAFEPGHVHEDSSAFESRRRLSRSTVREFLVSLSDKEASSLFLVVVVVVVVMVALFPFDRRSLRGKDIGLAAVVEGGARIEEETTGLGGSAWVSVGWRASG